MKFLAMNRSARAALAAILLAGFAPAAQAGDMSGLERWKERASTRVSETMIYPRLIGRRDLPAGHNVVVAEIDRSGRVLSAEVVEGSGRPEFDRASRDFADRLTRLPALPDSIAGETVKLRMHLVYADNERDLARHLKVVVRTRRLADAGRQDGSVPDAPLQIELFGGIR